MTKVPIDRATIQAVAQLIAQKIRPGADHPLRQPRPRQRRLPQRHRSPRRPQIPRRLAQTGQSHPQGYRRTIHPSRRRPRQHARPPGKAAQQSLFLCQHRSRISAIPLRAGRLLNRTASKSQNKTWKWPNLPSRPQIQLPHRPSRPGRGRPCACPGPHPARKSNSPIDRPGPVGAGLVPALCLSKSRHTISPTAAAHSPPDPSSPKNGPHPDGFGS